MSHEPAQNRTETASDAQEAPVVIRELQAARETKWAEAIWPGEWCEEDLSTEEVRSVMALAAEETFEATSALRQELAQAQAALSRVREVRQGWLEGWEPVHHKGYIADLDRALAAEPTPAAEPHAEDGAWTCRRCGNPQHAHINGACPVCAKDVGDPPEVCRCLLPRGHSGIHSCKHAVSTGPAPVADPDDTKDGQR